VAKGITGEEKSYHGCKMKILKRPTLESTLLISITAIAAFIRLYKLGAWSFWIDEMCTVQYACTGHWYEGPMQISYPVNFLITGLFLRILGISEFGARFFPFLMGCLSIPVMYYFVKKMFNKETAILTALFLAFSPWHIYESQNARHFSLLFLLSGSSLFCFYFAWEEKKTKLMIASALFLIAAIFTHSSAIFLLPVYLLYSVLLHLGPFDRPEGMKTRRLIVTAFVVFLAVFLVVLPVYLILGEYLLAEMVAWNPPSNIFMSLIHYIGVAFICISIFTLLFLLHERDRRGLYMGLFIAVTIFLLLVSAKFTIASGEYAYPTLIAHFSLAALACTKIIKILPKELRILGVGLSCILLLTLVSSDYLYFRFENGNRPKWKEASEFVSRRFEEEDRVGASVASIVEFYLARPVHWLGQLDVNQVKASKNRYWFIVRDPRYQASSFSREFREFLLNDCQLMTRFEATTGPKRRDVEVFLYVP